MAKDAGSRVAVVVAGSREWPAPELVRAALERMWERCGRYDGELLVIHGGCETGADAAAEAWAVGRMQTACNVSKVVLRADWENVFPREAAGPQRNKHMIDMLCAMRRHGYLCFVLAFPLGQGGTSSCMKYAKHRGLDVVDVWEPQLRLDF